MALKSSGARAQKRNKTKSLFKFKSRGHTGVIIRCRGRRLFITLQISRVKLGNPRREGGKKGEREEGSGGTDGRDGWEAMRGGGM